MSVTRLSLVLALSACTSGPEDTATPSGPAADLDVSETSLPFGNVTVGGASTRVLTLANDGEGDLELGTLQVIGDTSFTVGTLASATLAPGESEDVTVTFSPTEVGATEALLKIPSNDPAEPTVNLPLTADAVAALITLSPDTLDFGTDYETCFAAETVTLTNAGDAAVTVTSLTATGDEDTFVLDTLEADNGALPWELAAGASKSVAVTVAPPYTGTFAGSLSVYAEGVEEPVSSARLTVTSEEVDHVTEEHVVDGGMVDIVMPIQAADEYTDVDALAAAFPDFLDLLDGYGIDWQMAIAMPEDGCVYSEEPFFSSQMSRDDQLEIFEQQIDGTEWAHGLIVAAAMVSTTNTDPGGCNEGLIREKAHLAVVGYTFVGENHPDVGWMSPVREVQGRKEDSSMVTFNGIIEDLYDGCGWGTHSYWSDAVDMTGGVWYSICDPIEDGLAGIAASLVHPQTSYALEQVPDTATLVVTQNGEAITGWTYDADTNTVDLDTEPAIGDEIGIEYVVSVECD